MYLQAAARVPIFMSCTLNDIYFFPNHTPNTIHKLIDSVEFRIFHYREIGFAISGEKGRKSIFMWF